MPRKTIQGLEDMILARDNEIARVTKQAETDIRSRDGVIQLFRDENVDLKLTVKVLRRAILAMTDQRMDTVKGDQ